MTIKTQAYLQGYMHEKTAAEKPRVTPIVAEPGIPQTAPDPGVKPLFIDGKARFKRTQLKMPTTTPWAEADNAKDPIRGRRRSSIGHESLTPASVADQHLQNLSIPAADFVAEQKRNYERLLRHRWNLWSDLISFDKRNQPVSLDTGSR